MKAAKASVAQALAAATKAGRCGLNAAGRFFFLTRDVFLVVNHFGVHVYTYTYIYIYVYI